MGWPTLTTDRLVLRPLAMDDLDDLAALSAEESFWRYPFGRGWSRSETESSLERTIERYQDPGVAVSAVVVSDTGELAGWVGLSVPMFFPEILPAVEHGVRLHFARFAGIADPMSGDTSTLNRDRRGSANERTRRCRCIYRSSATRRRLGRG